MFEPFRNFNFTVLDYPSALPKFGRFDGRDHDGKLPVPNGE